MTSQSTASTKSRWLLFAILLPVLVLLLWLPQQLTSQTADTNLPASDCLLNNQKCNNQLGSQLVSLSVNDTNINSMSPITFNLELEGIEATQVLLDLQGKDMYMGINQLKLTPIANKPGQWHGQTELGLCVTGMMRWQAQIIAKTPTGSISTYFEFDAI